MTTVDSYSEHVDSHILNTLRSEFNFLKSLAIYGNNEGGKSNLIKVISNNSFKCSLSK